MKKKPLVLVLDPDATARANQFAALDRAGYLVATEGDAQKGLEYTTQRKPDVVVTNVCMLEDGKQNLPRMIKKLSPETRVVITANASPHDPAGRGLTDAVREELETRSQSIHEL